MTVQNRLLHEGWTLIAARGPVMDAGSIPASVPGTVHTDLLAAGLIDDPYLDENEKLQGWIGLTDWTYRTEFDAMLGSEHQELVFEGLDTIAAIRLNGAEIGSTRNMHRSHRFDVGALLLERGNVLEVAFASPIRAADEASLELGYRPHTNHHPYNAIRKMACGFGWDWGIDTSTSGIWRPVRLESWSGARLGEIGVAGDVIDGAPRIRADIAVRGGADAVRLTVSGAGVAALVLEEPVVAGRARFDAEVADAALWWPRGHGEQPLYDVSIELIAAERVVDAAERRIGFRSARVELAPDEKGTGVSIVVNDRPISIRGANWIPDDVFPHRVDRARYARRLQQAEFGGINLIRVWGGGIYESEDFYAECDERGILTWQDFLLACAAYAEEDPLYSEFEAEAREAIVRLGAHPSLVVLNGNNENIWGYQDWNWPQRLDGRTWGAGYYYDLFPRLVAELAPQVPYTPGSPFSPDAEMHQNDQDNGTVHVWDVWNAKDWTHYRDWRPRFVAEFGWQGPPAWTTLRESVSDDPLTPESPGMIVHQKANKGNDKLTDGLTAHVPLPNDMRNWHWAMSWNQAVAVRTAIEWWRSLEECTGTIVWQLNDCWPVTSWAAVDGAERPKPLLHALRKAHAERLVTVQPDGGEYVVALLNDTAEEWTGELLLERRGFDGALLAGDAVTVSVPVRGRSRVVVPAAVADAGDEGAELIVVGFDGRVAHLFFAEPRDSALAAAEVDVDAVRGGDGWVVTVTARTLVRDLALLVDVLPGGAEADDALITLLPGESATIAVRGAADASATDFAAAPVLRTLNDLVAVA